MRELPARVPTRRRRLRELLALAGVVLHPASLPGVAGASRALTRSGRDPVREADLRRALAEERFELHYQTVVGADSGTILGLEALLRLRRADGTLVPPGDFIALAEDSGLIEPIGAWVVDEACRQLSAWRDAGIEIMVGVNVSPRQLHRTDVVAVIAEALARHGAAPGCLIVELTETALRSDVADVRTALERLEALGVRSAIDDFGADYSSLARLRELPVGMLKVDRSFVRDATDDPRAAALLAAIIGVAQALSMRTVVEGIETAQQLELVRGAGADLAQGFHLARPEPADAMTQRLLGASRGELQAA